MESEHVCRSSGNSLRFIGHESVKEILCKKAKENPLVHADHGFGLHNEEPPSQKRLCNLAQYRLSWLLRPAAGHGHLLVLLLLDECQKTIQQLDLSSRRSIDFFRTPHGTTGKFPVAQTASWFAFPIVVSLVLYTGTHYFNSKIPYAKMIWRQSIKRSRLATTRFVRFMKIS